jgi:hypothetical protein
MGKRNESPPLRRDLPQWRAPCRLVVPAYDPHARPAGPARGGGAGAAPTGQNPPVYRTRLGKAEITVVSDGTIGFPPAMVLPEVPEADLEAFLAALPAARQSAAPAERHGGRHGRAAGAGVRPDRRAAARQPVRSGDRARQHLHGGGDASSSRPLLGRDGRGERGNCLRERGDHGAGGRARLLERPGASAGDPGGSLPRGRQGVPMPIFGGSTSA